MRILFSILLFLVAQSFFSQNIYTYAGTGVSGYSGDGGQAISAMINSARHVAFDASGNMYIADLNNHRVRKMTPAGIISTFAGTGVAGYSGDGALATLAKLNGPIGVAVDKIGNVYVLEYVNNTLRKINTSGIISTIAGNIVAGFGGDGGPAINSQFSSPSGIAIDTAGNIFVADGVNNRIRKINTAGNISTIAGTGTPGNLGDTVPAVQAQLNNPRGICADIKGNVYFVEPNNNCVRRIDLSGTIITIAGKNYSAGFSGDNGPAVNAEFNLPYGIGVDSAGNLFVADYANDRVRKITKSGIITTVAGNGTTGYTSGPAVSARLNGPMGVAVTDNGNIYIADFYNYRVRVVCNGPCAVGIEEMEKEEGSLKLYPNPNTGSFHINIDKIENGELHLINSIGQKVFEQKISEGINSVQANELPKGIYHYMIFANGGIMKAGKLVVE